MQPIWHDACVSGPLSQSPLCLSSHVPKVEQCIHIIRVLHLEYGHPQPFKDSCYVKTTLTGTEKAKVCAVHSKTPATTDLLRGLNMSCVENCVF